MVLSVLDICPNTVFLSAVSKRLFYYNYLSLTRITKKKLLTVDYDVALKQNVYNIDRYSVLANQSYCQPLIRAQQERWQGQQFPHLNPYIYL